MTISEFLKRAFIPFYWIYKTKKHSDEVLFAFIYGMLLTIYIISRLILGMHQANNPNKCRLKSIGDVITSPMYTIGCNIAKDRFDIKVN